VEQTGELCSLRLPLAWIRRPIARRRADSAGPRGSFERHQTGVPANQRAHRAGLSAANHNNVASGGSEIALRPKKTILCVDDNEQVLSVRTFLLETRGYRIIGVQNAQEAIEVLERSVPGSLDLILCDLLMPQMDGNELVRRAKQIHPGLPAMIVSGTVNAFDRALYADVFLPKGASSPAEMIERIRVLVARKRGPKKATIPSAARSEDTPAFAHATAS
jgi:two-component system, OmpR family, response regulator CpxR